MTKPLSRKQAREAIREMPIENVLLVQKSELTKKQKEFAKAVALGETGAAAYRQAYDTNSKPKHQSLEASKLKANPAIAREIEAIKLANEAAAYRSAESLRALVIHSLTQVLIDPETKHAQRIQAAKVLGTVTEIAAFTERKQITHIKDSGEIRDQIMSQLKTYMLSSDDVVDVDANSLLDELIKENEGGAASNSEAGDPHPTPTPLNINEPPPDHEHTIPHEPPHTETTPIDFEIKG